VLVLTMSDDDDSVFAAMQAGVRGYLVNGAGPADTVRAVGPVAGGDAIFGPGIAERVQRFFAATRSSAQPPPTPVEGGRLGAWPPARGSGATG
jgi:DNA-binding NarL/FixJ family response regulator